MHRHGYKGRKFGRHRDQRQALITGLATALVMEKSIETTLPKAKETLRYTEKLISKAKRGGLHNRRQIISDLSVAAANQLVDDIAPKLTGRSSGYLSIERTGFRRGDNAQMAKLSFVDDLSAKPPKKPVKVATKPAATAKKQAFKAETAK